MNSSELGERLVNSLRILLTVVNYSQAHVENIQECLKVLRDNRIGSNGAQMRKLIDFGRKLNQIVREMDEVNAFYRWDVEFCFGGEKERKENDLLTCNQVETLADMIEVAFGVKIDGKKSNERSNFVILPKQESKEFEIWNKAKRAADPTYKGLKKIEF